MTAFATGYAGGGRAPRRRASCSSRSPSCSGSSRSAGATTGSTRPATWPRAGSTSRRRPARCPRACGRGRGRRPRRLRRCVPGSGPPAAGAHALTVLGGWSYDLWLKPTPASFVPYAVAFGALPAFVTLSAAPPHLPEAGVMAGGGLAGPGRPLHEHGGGHRGPTPRPASGVCRSGWERAVSLRVSAVLVVLAALGLAADGGPRRTGPSLSGCSWHGALLGFAGGRPRWGPQRAAGGSPSGSPSVRWLW